MEGWRSFGNLGSFLEVGGRRIRLGPIGPGAHQTLGAAVARSS